MISVWKYFYSKRRSVELLYKENTFFYKACNTKQTLELRNKHTSYYNPENAKVNLE